MNVPALLPVPIAGTTKNKIKPRTRIHTHKTHIYTQTNTCEACSQTKIIPKYNNKDATPPPSPPSPANPTHLQPSARIKAAEGYERHQLVALLFPGRTPPQQRLRLTITVTFVIARDTPPRVRIFSVRRVTFRRGDELGDSSYAFPGPVPPSLRRPAERGAVGKGVFPPSPVVEADAQVCLQTSVPKIFSKTSGMMSCRFFLFSIKNKYFFFGGGREGNKRNKGWIML